MFTKREAVTLGVDVCAHLAAKGAVPGLPTAQRRGGVRTIALLLALPGPLARKVLGTEWFVQVV